MTNLDWKIKAKNQLGGQLFGNLWLGAVLVCLIVSVLDGAAGKILPALGSILITGPLFYGQEKLFYRQATDGGEMKVENLFDGFKDDFTGIFVLGLIETILIALWSLLLVVPGVMKAYAYSQTYRLKVDHPEYDWRTCLSESTALMNGHKMELFLLDLSFIGWYIVGALCAGIGTMWVAAYHNAARAQYYCDLTATRVL